MHFSHDFEQQLQFGVKVNVCELERSAHGSRAQPQKLSPCYNLFVKQQEVDTRQWQQIFAKMELDFALSTREKEG